MTKLSEIRSFPDLINYIWEHDKDHNWTLTREEADDVPHDRFELMSSHQDKKVLWPDDIAKARGLHLDSIFFGGFDFLPLRDTKLCGVWFKGGEFFYTDKDSFGGLLARDTPFDGRVYKKETIFLYREGGVVSGTLAQDAEVDGTRKAAGTQVGKRIDRRSDICGRLLEDGVLSLSRRELTDGVADSPDDIPVSEGAKVCRKEDGIYNMAFQSDEMPSVRPLGGSFAAPIEEVHLNLDGTVRLSLADKVSVPVKKILQKIETLLPISVRTLVNFLPPALDGLRNAEATRSDKGGLVYEPVSPKELVTKILDSETSNLDMYMDVTIDGSGKPRSVTLYIPSFAPSVPAIRLQDSPLPTSMPYFDEILKIVDEELATANPLPESTDEERKVAEPAAIPAISVARPVGDAPSPLPNLRIAPSYQYIFGGGHRLGGEVEAGYEALGVGGEYARTSAFGDAKALKEWRVYGALRLEPLPILGTRFLVGGRGVDGAEERLGLEVGGESRVMITSNWMVELSPSYAFMKGADIFDLGGGVEYKAGNVGASLGYRARFTDGERSHGPSAGLFAWF